MTGLWTPSQCTDLKGSNNTQARVDSMLSGDDMIRLSDNVRCRSFYDGFGCPLSKVKLIDPNSNKADCSWACGLGAKYWQILFSCNNQTDCDTAPTSPSYLRMACSSFEEMHTAMCDQTPEQIKAIVASMKQRGQCQDNGPTFSAIATVAVQTTPAPTRATAPVNTKFFVTLTVTLPYTRADFDKSKQDKYMVAIAAAAGTSAANVEILAITEKRRRAGSVDVQTKVANAPLVPCGSRC